MSHKANDPYNEAGIDILKHGAEKSHAMLKKQNMAKRMKPKKVNKNATY